jgi:UDP-2-acetamido-2-deoxy-ribo-hexuluronate aminotransferase
LHLQKAYKWLNYRAGEFPVAENASAEILSLPMFPQLTTDQLARVVDEIRNFSLPELRKGTEAQPVSLA